MSRMAMENRQVVQGRKQQSQAFSPLAFVIVTVAFAIGVVISRFNPLYSALVTTALILIIIVLLKLNEIVAVLIVAAHVFLDSYLNFGVYQFALLMALMLLAVCYLVRSADHPWTAPPSLWLWALFLTLNIYPTINGGSFKLTNAIASYLNLVFSAFIMFWLGNVVAKDIPAVRRVFQLLSLLATFIAIHTIIEATTGIFLFQTSTSQFSLDSYNNFQVQGAGVFRAGSFLFNPDDNSTFLATSFFLPFGLFIESRRVWAKALYLLEMLAILVALLFTYSTGSWVAVLAGIGVLMFLVGSRRYLLFMPMLLITLAAIASIVFPSQIAVQLQRASDPSIHANHIATWQTAAGVIGAYPLLGVGLGDQAFLVRAEPFRAPAQTVPQSEPDNSYLQWGATSGIPAMLVFLLLLIHVYWLSWRNWLLINKRYRSLLAGGIVALVVLSINSMVVDGWTNPGGVEYLGWLVAGVVSSQLIRASSVSTVSITQ